MSQSPSFDSLALHPELRRAVADAGFTVPTPVQQKAIPPAMAGRDLLACAMTGSGKTAAFLLPILERLRALPRSKTRALVLTPTRELAAQIVEHGRVLARHTGIRFAPVFGGVAMGPQEKAFRDGVEIFVACPGRLLDHLQNGSKRLPDLDVLVLDEADRMLDMGFLPDVKRVLRALPKPKQTLFFSATMPAPIVELSREMLRDPVKIDVDRPARPATGVDQALFPVPEELKRHLLVELLRRGVLDRALVFTRTKHRANRLADFLAKQGVVADRIHGNRSQPQRTKALADFKDGRCRVLVATDIAARGIDVEALEHVVNFDVPHVAEDYVHRVGRTGRADATGEAFTFVSPAEEADVRSIERAVGRKLPRRALDGFDYQARPVEKLEIPLADRIAAIRARKGEERQRARANAERRVAAPSSPRPAQPSRAAGAPRPAAPDRDRRHAGSATLGDAVRRPEPRRRFGR